MGYESLAYSSGIFHKLTAGIVTVMAGAADTWYTSAALTGTLTEEAGCGMRNTWHPSVPAAILPASSTAADIL